MSYRGFHHILYILRTHAFTVDSASLPQTTQETIPFTTVAFSFYGFLLMCSLAFLCWALSPRRQWSGENSLCLLQHTSKRALLCKGKVLREPADCLPIMHCCLLDRTIFRGIYSAVGYGQRTGPDYIICHNGLEITFSSLKQHLTHCCRRNGEIVHYWSALLKRRG